MVDRKSEEFRLNVGREQYQGLNLGAGAMRRPQAEGPGVGEQALNGLLSFGGAIAQQGVDMQAQEAYLQGQRARMSGQAQDAVDSDVFSKPFVQGGYQDEDYRIGQATMAAEMNAFIKSTGRAMSPAEFGKVLQERSAKLGPQFQNLSMRGRLQATQAQSSMEAGLIAKQAAAYQQFSIEQGSKRFLAQGNQIMTDLVSAGPADKQAQNERAALYYTDLLTTDKLPESERTRIATDYLGALANADQRDVVEQLRNAGALDNLPFDERKKLDSALRESRNRTEAVDSLGVVMSNGEFEASIAAGKMTDPSRLESYINQETNAGRMTYEQGKSLRMSYLKGVANVETTANVMRALGNRDLDSLAALGYTGPAALEQMDKQLAANGKTLPQRLAVGLGIGLDIGQLPKSYGETIGMAVRHVQGAGTGEMNQQLVDTLNQTISTLQVAEQKNPGAKAVLLGSMPEDTKAAMSYALTQQEHGVAPAQALKEFAINKEAFLKLDNLQQGMQTAKFKQEVADLAVSSTKSGFWGRVGNFVTGQSNLQASSYDATTMQVALQDELGRITSNRDNVGMTPEAALKYAQANVQARTISVGESGWLGTGTQRRLLVLPEAASIARVFGTNDKVAIGRALNERYKSVDGYDDGFQFNRATGRLEHVLVNRDTAQVVQREPVNAEQIGKDIESRRARIYQEASDAAFGAPIQVNGQTVKVDGGNTYEQPTKAVYNWRKDLAGQEGLSLTVYKDRNGLAVGMGRNVTGRMKEGQQISVEQAQQWFREDTDRALGQATRVASDLGVREPSAVMGLAGAIYQLGDAGLAQHKRTAEALRNRDFHAFEAEVKSSDWYKQTPNRAEYFIDKMKPHFVSGFRRMIH